MPPGSVILPVVLPAVGILRVGVFKQKIHRRQTCDRWNSHCSGDCVEIMSGRKGYEYFHRRVRREDHGKGAGDDTRALGNWRAPVKSGRLSVRTSVART